MAYTRLIQAPPEVKYLSEFLPNGELPRNCLFDKVLTGCGGTYLALTSPEPYVIAVPTKALVWDKVTSKSCKDLHIAGVSEDFPIGDRNLNLCNKIIVTYKSLPRVAEKLTMSSYNLLVDEAHMLISMNGYAREELSWLLENFKNFKSYCFMSATIPRKENLLEALKEVDKVRIAWEDVYQTDFRCLIATSIEEAVLSVMLDHMRKKVPGTPYFFYNSVAGICKLYEDNLEECLQKYPEWSDIIHRVGLDTCKALKYSKSKVKAYDQGLSLQQSAETERTVKRSFQVGQIYAITEIKKILDKLGFEKPKGTMLSRWFHIKKTTKNGAVAYKILAPLDCFELD